MLQNDEDAPACPTHCSTMLKNDEDAPVKRGNNQYGRGNSHDGSSKFYCGRHLGKDALPGSDGQCGPSGGPQCTSCTRFQKSLKNDEGATVSLSPLEPLKFYCGRLLPVPGDVQDRSDYGDYGPNFGSKRGQYLRQCGPNYGDQCAACERFQADPEMALDPASFSDPRLCDAARKGDLDEVRSLLNSKANVHWRTDRRETVLHMAAGSGHIEVVQLLLQSNSCYAQVNAQDDAGVTPLHWGVSSSGLRSSGKPMERKEQSEIVKILLHSSAIVNAASNDTRTPLHTASIFGSFGVAQQLIQSGATVEAKTKERKTALHCAASNGHVDIAQLLLQNGAQVDPKARSQRTPLHDTAARGRIDVAKLLIQNGADASSEDKDGKTPMDIAKSNAMTASRYDAENGRHYGKIVNLLAAVEELKRLAENGGSEYGARWEVRRALNDGANVNARNKENGTTVLMTASRNGHVQIVEELLNAKGIEVNAKDDNNAMTALMHASYNGHVGVISALLAMDGIEINATDKDNGLSALMLATYAGHDSAVATLLKSDGIDTTIRVTGGDKGKTALEIARGKDQSIVRGLLEAHALDASISGVVKCQECGGNLQFDPRPNTCNICESAEQKERAKNELQRLMKDQGKTQEEARVEAMKLIATYHRCVNGCDFDICLQCCCSMTDDSCTIGEVHSQEATTHLSSAKEGLATLLEGVNLAERLAQASEWCAEMGIDSIAMLKEVKAEDQFVAALMLKPSIDVSSDAAASASMAVEGLAALLDGVNLGDRLAQATAWCTEMRVDSLAMLKEVKAEANFVEALQLKPLKAKQLQLRLAKQPS